MKKTKLISCLLTLATLLTCMFSLFVPANAATPEMPTTIPSGAYASEKTWVDWSALGLNGTTHEITDQGFLKIKKAGQDWSGTGNTTFPEPYAWCGASGLMFQVDASQATKIDFTVTLMTVTGRTRSNKSNGNVQLNSIPVSGKTSYAYYYADGKWNEVSTTGQITASKSASGWWYIPFTSIWYKGPSNDPSADDVALGTNFTEFMSKFEDGRVGRAAIYTKELNQLFSDIHLIYDNPIVQPEAVKNAASAPMFGTMKSTGTATGTVNGNAITVPGMSGNTLTSTPAYVAVTGLTLNNLKNASGLRFHVDTTALGDATLQLRVRMLASKKFDPGETFKIYAANSAGYVAAKTKSAQYSCRNADSVAYYFDEAGEPVALHVQSNVLASPNSDVFDALPRGYVGDVYIPFDSFSMSLEGTTGYCLPFAAVCGEYPIGNVTIAHVISGTATTDSVEYSNFEAVYADTAISGASLTLTNNLNLNFYANVEDDATLPTMTFTVNEKSINVNGEKQANGSYRFVYENILPQNMGEQVTAKLNAKVGTVAVYNTMTYSAQEYCETLLAREGNSAELNTLLVDLLSYGAAAQTYAGLNEEHLATENLTSEQLAFKSADKTAAITATLSKAGTANADYEWQSATLVLENAVALKLKLNAADTNGLTAEVTLNGRTEMFSEFDGESGIFTLTFKNIGATEMDSDITLTLKKDGVAIGETLTVSVAAYIKVLLANNPTQKTSALAKAVYAYGSSAAAYAAQ